MAVGDIDGARVAIDRAHAGFEDTDDIPGAMNSLLHLGLLARAAGDHATARAVLTRALGLEGVAGSTCATGWVEIMLFRLAEEAHDHDSAEASAAHALGLFTQLGDTAGLAHLRRIRPGPQSRR